MPFNEVVGSADSAPPAQIAATALKVGVSGDAMVTSRAVVAVAH